MRSPITLAALSLFSLTATAVADPFATRRPPQIVDPAPAPEEPVVVEHTRPAEDSQASDRTVARIFGVTGLTLGVSAMALGFYEKHRYNSAVTRGDYEAADDARDVLRYAGTGLLAASVVSLGISLYFYATMPESRRTVVAPVASPDQVGVSLAHSF